MFFGVSCQNDDNSICDKTYHSFVTDVKGGNVGKVGETVVLTIEIQAKNGCSETDGFDIKSDGNTKTYEPRLTYKTCGSCPQNGKIITSYFDFISGKPGTYKLKFKSGEDEFITFTLIIQP